MAIILPTALPVVEAITLAFIIRVHIFMWRMDYEGVPLLVLADEMHNRMRIISPAAKAKDLDRDTLMRMIEANFASALDARYAVSQGIVWAAFIHPAQLAHRARPCVSAQTSRDARKDNRHNLLSSELQFGGPYETK